MKNKKKQTRIVFLFLITVTIPFYINCGYHLSGAGSTLPEGAKTIAIPDFENLSASPDAQQYITFAIRDEFIRRSKLKLTDDISEVDLVLEGVINQFIVKPISYTERISANVYSITLSLDVKLVDKNDNKIIFQIKK